MLWGRGEVLKRMLKLLEKNVESVWIVSKQIVDKKRMLIKGNLFSSFLTKLGVANCHFRFFTFSGYNHYQPLVENYVKLLLAKLLHS